MSIGRWAILVVILVVFQVPMLHNWVVMSVAFPFQYIGLILLLPHRMGRGWVMLLAFVLGLIIDIFSNTPGMHASCSVLIAFGRQNWFGFVADLTDEDVEISLNYLSVVRFAVYCLPLIFIHHLLLFTFENEGFGRFLLVLRNAFWSTWLSFSVVLISTMLITRKVERR